MLYINQPKSIKMTFNIPQRFISHEKEISQFWEENNILTEYETLSGDNFRFIDGPPFVSGKLHLGSASISYIKDTVLRYFRMHNKKSSVRIGFDCHGLPSENMVMKQLNLNSNAEIEKFGVPKFIKECIDTINLHSNSWKPTFEKLGRTVDFNNQYKTIDINFMESVWWVFSEINKKGLIYNASKVMPYSLACETPLSNFEAGQAYKKIQTNSVYVKFAIKKKQNTYFVVWTTTCWTLPSNCALCVGPNIMYLNCYLENGDVLILAEGCEKNVGLNFTKIEQLGLGSTLKDIEYEPLFNCMDFMYHRVLVDNYVTSSNNSNDEKKIDTGIVHLAFAHGADDCRVGLANNAIDYKNLHKTCLIDSKGNFVCDEFLGKHVFDVDKTIIEKLKNKNMFVGSKNYEHSYPFCYRSDTKLIYKIVPSHFVAVTKIKDQLVEMNDKITWSNPKTGNERFKSWILDPQDWCISRNRYFGNPIPVWVSDDNTEHIVIGSIDELVEHAKLDKRPVDLHIDTIANITITSSSGKILKHIGTCFDCWFESGAVPFGQLHYPFENKNAFDNEEFLCDFIAEGLDQTRGWFYTLLVISTIITQKPAFKNVICSGLILDEKGQKLSKRNGNFVEPDKLIEDFGADNIRLYLLSSVLVNGEPLSFNSADIKNVARKTVMLFNLISLYSQQKTIIEKNKKSVKITYIPYNNAFNTEDIADKWILTKTFDIKNLVETHMNAYHIDKALITLLEFIEDISSWYVKISGSRLKGKEGDNELETSLSVLFTVLYDFTILFAPFAPFTSEYCYKYLTNEIVESNKDNNNNLNTCGLNLKKSVHLCKYPQKMTFYTNNGFDELKTIIGAFRQLRSKSKTHTTMETPFKKCTIYHNDELMLEKIKNIIDIAHDEINCIDFEYVVLSKDHYVYTPNVNQKSLGNKCKGDKNKIEKKINNLNQTELNDFMKSHSIIIDGFMLDFTDFTVSIIPNIQRKENTDIIMQEGFLLEVDLTFNIQICEMQNAKKFARIANKFRKELNLKPWNKIKIKYVSTGQCDFMENQKQYISSKFDMPFEKFDNEFTEFKLEYDYIDFDKNKYEMTIYLYKL